MGHNSILPDVLAPGLKVVFCGYAVGEASAKASAYYAGPRNTFWQTLHCIRLTNRQLAPYEYKEVLTFGLGLTDIVKHQAGADHNVKPLGTDIKALRDKIEKYQPLVLAFNGKKTAKTFLRRRRVSYGLQTDTAGIGRTALFVLPSTSGAARRYWDKRYWRDLAHLVG